MYLVDVFKPNIFVLVIGCDFWTEYICIRIRFLFFDRIYLYSYSVFICGPNIFVFVIGFYFWAEYIRIRIQFSFLEQIYSYLYLVFIFEPNIFIFVFGFNFWTEYIHIRIWWSKYYSLTSVFKEAKKLCMTNSQIRDTFHCQSQTKVKVVKWC